MGITIFAGKGGVGKSTAAAAFALNHAEQGEVLIVDYDGGHSLTRVFSLPETIESNQGVSTGMPNLSLAVIDPIKFKTIADSQNDGDDIQTYLRQFNGDYGLVPFCDMITTFFGAPTDTYAVSRFASLTDVYHRAKQKDVDNLIIDVEPTAGLERLLGSTEATARSIKNLQELGIMRLSALGAVWPDIKAYLKGSFIQNADEYAARLVETSEAMKGAEYFVVCIPESSPVDEMGDVESIIGSYNGRIKGYVVNNIRGEPHEPTQIQRVYDRAGELPVLEVKHDLRLCDSNPTSRQEALREVGNLF